MLCRELLAEARSQEQQGDDLAFLATLDVYFQMKCPDNVSSEFCPVVATIAARAPAELQPLINAVSTFLQCDQKKCTCVRGGAMFAGCDKKEFCSDSTGEQWGWECDCSGMSRDPNGWWLLQCKSVKFGPDRTDDGCDIVNAP
jgi:hypothetical protein